jgi:putative flippase GtrA
MPQFLRYLIVGLGCAGLEYGSFLLLHHGLHWGLISANTLAYGLGLLASFSFNKLWVFAGRQQHQTPFQLAAYCLLAFVNYSLGTWLLLYLAQTLGLYAWLAKGVSMFAIVVWNFLIYKKIIYR